MVVMKRSILWFLAVTSTLLLASCGTEFKVGDQDKKDDKDPTVLEILDRPLIVTTGDETPKANRIFATKLRDLKIRYLYSPQQDQTLDLTVKNLRFKECGLANKKVMIDFLNISEEKKDSTSDERNIHFPASVTVNVGQDYAIDLEMKSSGVCDRYQIDLFVEATNH